MSGSGQATRQVLLLGLDQVEWNLLRPLAEQGRLRYVAQLLAEGRGGPIVVPPPADPVAQWTTLSTGKWAHLHGVLCSTRARPDGRGAIPATWSASASVHLAEMACARGLHVHLIGWPGASPAPPLDGIVVDPQFAVLPADRATRRPSGRPWCHPPVAAAEVFARRVLPHEVDEMTLAGLIPSDLRGGEDHALEQACRQAVAETSTLFRLAKFALGITPWDAAFCVLPLLGRLAPLAGEVIATTGNTPLADAIQLGAYEYLDLLIGQLLHQAGSSVDVVLVGLGRLRPCAVVRTSWAVAGWPHDASLLDVVPTTLTLLGLPTADDLPGRSWIDLPADAPRLQPIPSWDAAAVRIATPEESSRRWPPEPAYSADDDHDVGHLLDLGYTDPHETAACEEAQQLRDVADFHRALSLADAGATDDALGILTRLADAAPTWIAVGNALAEMHLRLGRVDEAQARLQQLVERGAESGQLYLLQGQIALARRNMAAAEQAVYVAGRIDPRLPSLPLLRGVVASRRGNYEAATEAYLQATREAENPAAAEDGLAVCCLVRGELEEAVDHALRVIAANPTYARAHYRLGRALALLDRPEDAQLALTRAAQLDADLAAPYYWLARLADDSQQQRTLRQRGVAIIRQRKGPRSVF